MPPEALALRPRRISSRNPPPALSKLPEKPGPRHSLSTYGADHLALMDHLGFDKFHVLGGCIGGSFCLKAVQAAPARVAAAVLQNLIGQHPEHPDYFPKAMWNGAASSAPSVRS